MKPHLYALVSYDKDKNKNKNKDKNKDEDTDRDGDGDGDSYRDGDGDNDEHDGAYAQPLILAALAARLPVGSYTLITDDDAIDLFLASVGTKVDAVAATTTNANSIVVVAAAAGAATATTATTSIAAAIGAVDVECNGENDGKSGADRSEKNNIKELRTWNVNVNGNGNRNGGAAGEKPDGPMQILQMRAYEMIDWEVAFRFARSGTLAMGKGRSSEGNSSSSSSGSSSSGSSSSNGRRGMGDVEEKLEGDLGLSSCLVNAYMIRKALIRKHFLARCVEIAAVKSKSAEKRRRRTDYGVVKGWSGEGEERICGAQRSGDAVDAADAADAVPGQCQQIETGSGDAVEKFQLQKHFPVTLDFEIDYAEFLDEALVEAYELRNSFERNEKRKTQTLSEEDVDGEDGLEWWILKPSMGDGGHGIRIFSSVEELSGIFEEWEEEEEEEEEEEDEEEEGEEEHKDEARNLEERTGSNTQIPKDIASKNIDNDIKTPSNTQQSLFNSNSVITSQLRHFIAQRYIKEPLLFYNVPDISKRKFHIRTYVIAVGSLKVYVYKPMLALFAQKTYEKPHVKDSVKNLSAHLTNTCLNSAIDTDDEQYDNASRSTTGTRVGDKVWQRVKPFWDLPDSLPDPTKRRPYSNGEDNKNKASSTIANTVKGNWKDHVFAQICAITGAVFEAAAREMMVHFQTMLNAFEIFGVDFLLDKDGHAWLLEVNAFPDFKQTGEELKHIISGLFEGVVDVAVKPFFGIMSDADEGDNAVSGNNDVKCVLDIDLGRR